MNLERVSELPLLPVEVFPEEVSKIVLKSRYVYVEPTTC